MKSGHKTSNNRGFTIIEVLIVLAIVGLIILIIFLALPTLQRVERNNYRKQQAQFAVSQMEFYKNDKAKYPETTDERCDFVKNYFASAIAVDNCGTVGGSQNCVLGEMQRINVCFHDYGGDHKYIGDADELSIEFGHWCNRGSNYNNKPEEHIMSTTSAHDKSKYVAWVQLEKGPVYCVDNAPD